MKKESGLIIVGNWLKISSINSFACVSCYQPKSVALTNQSAANHDLRPLSSGKQEYEEYPEMFPLTSPLLKSLLHSSNW